MIVSLHGLLINRRQVRWDWLPLLSAACVLLLIIATWRVSFAAFRGATLGPPIWVFVLALIQSIGLYLAARAALPDHVPAGKPFDLSSYYQEVARYLWGALAGGYAVFILLAGLGPIFLGSIQFPTSFYLALAALPILLVLAIWPLRKLHRFLVPLYFLYLCVRLLPARLLVP